MRVFFYVNDRILLVFLLRVCILIFFVGVFLIKIIFNSLKLKIWCFCLGVYKGMIIYGKV